ncbi:MAG: acyltransferase [Myxococcales bacterium]|nr:acyltransferase [Myxococcales bacterium]
MNIALTQTVNAYHHMPSRMSELPALKDKLGAIRDANIEHHLELITSAASLGVKALCMGELFAGPYFALGEDPMWLGMAEDAATGTTITAMCEAALKHKMLLVAPIYELDSESGKRFNTAVVIENDSSILGKYRKTHIPAGTNDAGSFYETFYYERSDGKLGTSAKNISKNPLFPVFETSAGKIGVAICYDRHFPGVMKALAEQGAELIFSPAVTFGQKSQRMWELEFEVDAARHNVFIAGSNRRGSEAPWNQEYFGASHVVGPNGRAAAVAAPEGLVVADVDLAELTSPDPSGWNLSRDLRPDIY